MAEQSIREVVIRRVRLRHELKPVRACWHSGPGQPDWLVITHVTGPRGHDTFELQFLVNQSPACGTQPGAVMTGCMSYDTLQIAKAQAHADIGVEYVEWEPCHIDITNEDGSIEWGRALTVGQDAR